MPWCAVHAAPYRARTTARSAGRGPRPSHPRQQPTAPRHRDGARLRAGPASGQLPAASPRRTAAGARLTGSATRTRGTGPRRQPATRLSTVSLHRATVDNRPGTIRHAAATILGAVPASLAGAAHQARTTAACRASAARSLARATIQRPPHGAPRHLSAGFRTSAGGPYRPATLPPGSNRNTGARPRSPPAGTWHCASGARRHAGHRRRGRRARRPRASTGTPGRRSCC